MKKHLFFITAWILAVCFCLSVGATAADTPSSWAKEDVRVSIENGIVPAALQGNYTAPITRSQFCSLATAVYETVSGNEITARETFADTREEAVEKMAALGVVYGVGDGRFDPAGTLTREQAAAMIDRLAQAMGKPLTDRSAAFSDSAAISDWAKRSVGRVYSAGIMVGTGGGAFSPKGTYTVEQSIATMLRTMQTVSGEKKTDVVSSGSCGKQVKWTLDSDGVLTISGSGEMQYYNPKKTPWYAKRSQIQSAVVEEGVTSLGYSAFYDCTNLTTVTLPGSLTAIEGYALANCASLTAVQVPETVMSIGLRAFQNCDALQQITVASGNRNYRSSDGILFNKDGTELICYPGGKTQTRYSIPNGVTNITNSAFSGNDYLTWITIPDSVERIEGYAFENCGALTDLAINSADRLYWLVYGNQGINDYGTTPGTEYMDKVTIHSVDPRGTFTYTMTSLSDVQRLQKELKGLYPIYLHCNVPANQLDRFRTAIDECISAATKPDYFYAVAQIQSSKSSDTAVLRYQFSYINGMDLFPYWKGYVDTVSEKGGALLNRSLEILGSILTPGMSEYETVKAIHDWLVNNTTYDFGAPRAHSPEGPILDGRSVCEGYAEAFDLLCTLSDIDCLYIVGDTTQGAHAWNKVCVDGVWYNVDVTWDDPIGGVDTLRYDYFLISDATLSRDHTWNRDWVPACNRDYPGDHWNQQSSNIGNTSGGSTSTENPAGNRSVTDATEGPNEPEEYTGGYWDTWVDQYGFTWVEVDDTHWVLYIGGLQYAEFWQDIQEELWGATMESYVSGFQHNLEHTPSEQTAADIAPRERGW